MKVVKILLLVIFLIIAAGYYLLKVNPEMLTQLPFSETVFQLDQAELEKFTSTASEELKIISERSKEVGEHAQNVLGSTIEVNEEKQPIHERAIDYGRYIYCQQVVEDYESREAN